MTSAQAHVAALRAFKGRTFTAREILPALAQARQMAETQEARAWTFPTTRPMPQMVYSDVRQNLSQLRYLEALMQRQVGSAYRFASPHKTWMDVRNAILAPFVWDQVVADVVAVQNAAGAELKRDLINGIVNLPGAIVGGAAGYVVDQARQAVDGALRPLAPSLPSWVAPALLTTAALVVAAPYVTPIVRRALK
jgi:hypothetical protein